MDRPIIYPGQIPLETDLLNTNRNTMLAIAKVAAALFGATTFATGLAVTPDSPASMRVAVAPGDIYALSNLDTSAYSSLAADTAHQVVKQGINLDTTFLTLTAPGTAGQSVNYLIQATLVEADTGAVVLPYYNSSNPAAAYSGPNNSGSSQATKRTVTVGLQAKAGAAAATGTQATPAPDSGYIGLYVVTVANGQTTITAGNISAYPGAPVIPSAGLLVAGLQNSSFNIATAGGAADAIVANFSPAVTALSNGMTLYVRAANANATSTPTLQANGTAAKTVVKGAGSALSAGDIAGGGHWIEVQYDGTLDKWVLLNPATGVSHAAFKVLSVAASVAANALTLTLNPGVLDFRSATLTSGVPNTRPVQASISLTVPSGATLGTANATQARLVLVAIDNAGTVELAVANLSGGINLDETTLISTTAISAGATAANVIYSTTARTNVPFRVVGFVDITQATAGTWATAPTLVQGAGGQALAAMSSLGYGQKWVDVTASRASGTTYYNTTGKPICIFVNLYNTSVGTVNSFVVNGAVIGSTSSNPQTGSYLSGNFIVPPGASYSIGTGAGSPNIVLWTELR